MSKTIKGGIILGTAVLLGCLLLNASHYFLQKEIVESKSVILEEKNKTDSNVIESTLLDEVHLEVPLLLQMDEPQVYNGCEITSLAMLLNYFNIEVTKNELAANVNSVDYIDEDGNYGDPNEGFVGDIYGNNAGYFVYHEPIRELADQYITDELEVVDLTGENFEAIQSYLSQESPVWVITTTAYAPTDDMMAWETKNGEVEVSMSEHSVVLTGYDEESVYLNDPYGNEDYQVDLETFIESWEQMGSQAITISKS